VVTFKALKPGVFVYHCATPSVAHHIARGVQTVSVPPGGATIVDFKIERGGHYVLVDHALSRAERGLAGYLIVDGPKNDDIMHEGPAKQ
jgi:nitrite reductase (NO-forming)